MKNYDISNRATSHEHLPRCRFERISRFSSRLSITIIVVTMITCSLNSPIGAEPTPPVTPPEQPESGPREPEGAVGTAGTSEAVRVGTEPTGAWIFAPPKPVLDQRDGGSQGLPVVVLFHGYAAVDPARYREWIDHMVWRGALVVFPDYQWRRLIGDDWRDFFPNALTGVTDALAELDTLWPGLADRNRVSVVGHSLGGVLAANYAASARAANLPEADILVVLQPGGCSGCEPLLGTDGVPLIGLKRIPPSTRAVVVVAEDDDVVSDRAADLIWQGLSSVPREHRDFVLLRSDHHGEPDLRATHFVTETGPPNDELNALDWYGGWKFHDLLWTCAFDGENCDAAQGGSAEQRYMGRWSDGRPVREPVIGDGPDDVRDQLAAGVKAERRDRGPSTPEMATDWSGDSSISRR